MIRMALSVLRRKGKICGPAATDYEAVSVHFDEGTGPRRIRIHFVSDPILVQA
jgi:hypothetical protein